MQEQRRVLQFLQRRPKRGHEILRPSARDPNTNLTIYTSRASLPEAGGEMLYFVKTAANEYLRLRASQP